MRGEARAKTAAAGLAVCMVGGMAFVGAARPKSVAKPAIAEAVSREVPAIVAEAAKNPGAARAKMIALYRQNGLRAAADYVAAAQVVGTSGSKEELTLALDLAIAGLALGDASARPIVASTEDRLFAMVGLGERYGTLGGKTLPLTETHRGLLCGPPTPFVPPTQVLSD